MKHFLKKSLLFLTAVIVLSSCKEEFVANKGTQSGSISPIETTTNKLCSQSTLISPKVDILMLWDNSSSFYVVTPETRASMGQLITSVSENFDYHVLSVPLISGSSNTLFEAQLVAKNSTGLGSDAISVMKSKDTAAQSLGFTKSGSSAEPGIDRVASVIQANRANGIFRNDAYTIVVVISNEDDDSCESETGYSLCSSGDWSPKIQSKITKLLCLRGNTSVNCSGSGISSSLNSTMMRFINISPLTSCSTGNYKVNARYRAVAKALYEAPYTNGWPTSNDHISPSLSGYPDSYNLCSISFSSIFDGVNTAIKQTLLKHKYDYWPVAGSSASIDPDTVRVVRSDGKILTNRLVNSGASNGYELILDGNGKAATVTNNTRYYPTAGEPFTGRMIRLYGSEGNDKIVYPDCLTVTYDAEKAKYGYIYLKYGEPNTSTIEVRVNGNIVPQSSSNGWSYMGLQYMSALDTNYKVFDLPAGSASGYILKLNGSYQLNNTSAAINITVYYNSKNQ
ncbi:MAG: hypothetical protein K2Q18_00600 [Bdellovibrionales bacterium]|nr:hypothetical protein [Bdellovibrionales bacterium]